MAITAVAKLAEKTTRAYWQNNVSLKFAAAYTDKDGNRVNQEWADATPQFNLEMTVKPEIAAQFDFDKEYLLTFTPRD